MRGKTTGDRMYSKTSHIMSLVCSAEALKDDVATYGWAWFNNQAGIVLVPF